MNKYTETEEGQKVLEKLFQAYFDARRNKRNTINALAFERNFESKIFYLRDRIMDRSYEPSRGICFMIIKPVKREVFAADFGDRIVHHLVYNEISPIFEKTFINDCYSCRKGKGVRYGIKRADYFIRSCSNNYQKDCYVLRLDIRSYFLSMRRDLLYRMIEKELTKRKDELTVSLNLILFLLRKIIFHDPTKNATIKGSKKDWKNFPKNKSLFHAKKNCGLPIGNLTSQLFGNLYLSILDHFIKRLGVRYYGRYVDDIIIVHESKDFLLSIIPKIREFLKEELFLELHPNKIYLQHFSKGVSFLGVFIKPHRIYISNRVKDNFYNFLRKEKRFQSEKALSSYLGLMGHYSTFNLIKRFDEKLRLVD